MICVTTVLVDFNIGVDFVHKQRRPQVPQTTAHQPKPQAKHRHVAKVERGLKLKTFFSKLRTFWKLFSKIPKKNPKTFFKK